MKERTYYGDGYLRLCLQNLFDMTINHCIRLAKDIDRRPENLIFLLLSFHNLMQILMISSISKNDKLRVYTKKDHSEILQEAENSRTSSNYNDNYLRKFFDAFVDDFISLYKK